MAARTSTKTVTTEPQQVDVDNDGDIDAVVSHSATVTVTEEDCPPDEPPNDDPTPTPNIGTPGACGETACWSRTPVTFTQTNAGRVYTFTPAWPGNVAWNFGDGSAVVVGRGPVVHTYTAAGSVNVVASPVSSSVLKASAPVAITVV